MEITPSRGAVKNAADGLADAAKGWRWSGYSHPGISKIILEPLDSDRVILQQFKNQKHSATVNLTGSYRKFGKDWSDWLPTY